MKNFMRFGISALMWIAANARAGQFYDLQGGASSATLRLTGKIDLSSQATANAPSITLDGLRGNVIAVSSMTAAVGVFTGSATAPTAVFGTGAVMSTFNATAGGSTYSLNLASGVAIATGAVSFGAGGFLRWSDGSISTTAIPTQGVLNSLALSTASLQSQVNFVSTSPWTRSNALSRVTVSTPTDEVLIQYNLYVTNGVTLTSMTATASGVSQYSIRSSSSLQFLAGGIQWADGSLSTTASSGGAAPGGGPTLGANQTWTGFNIHTSTVQLTSAGILDVTSAVVRGIAVDASTGVFTSPSSGVAIPLSTILVGDQDDHVLHIEISWQANGGSPTMMSYSFTGDTKEDFTATCNNLGAAQSVNYITSASSIAAISVNCPAAGGGTKFLRIVMAYNSTSGNQIEGFSDSSYDTGGSVSGGGTHTNFGATNTAFPKFLKLFWNGSGTMNFLHAHVYVTNR